MNHATQPPVYRAPVVLDAGNVVVTPSSQSFDATDDTRYENS